MTMITVLYYVLGRQYEAAEVLIDSSSYVTGITRLIAAACPPLAAGLLALYKVSS